MRFFSTHHVNRPAPQLAGLIGIVAVLYVAAGLGMAYVAGFGNVWHRLQTAH
jgi:hypothetical protein